MARPTDTASGLLSLLEPDRIEELPQLLDERGREHARAWARSGEVVLYDEMRALLTRVACAWSGVPLADSEVGRRVRELTALFDGAGAVGPRHWRARLVRASADRWAARLIADVRAGRLRVPAGSAVATLALHRDHAGALLPPRVAAVELLNIIRPIVAVAIYVSFAAHALHHHPAVRDALADGEAGDIESFVHEVRRFYPFFPAVAARARRDIRWRGHHIPYGRRVLLDLYGTDHDPRAWREPQRFHPQRFRGWRESPFDFVPQGGGDHATNHRCPGEWATIALMRTATRLLARDIDYRVPSQDLSVDMARLPALPRDRMVITAVAPRR